MQSLSKTIHLSIVLAILLFVGLFFAGGDWAFEFYMEQKHIGFATGNHQIPKLGK